MNDILTKILNKIPVSSQIKSDTLWNVASLGLFGLSGLTVSFIISKYYPPEILGIFNINFAIIMILSQLAGGGIHYSVLHKISKHAGEESLEKEIISSGLIAELLSACLISFLLALSVNSLNILYDNPEDTTSIYYIIPAVFFLAVNKVMLAFFNGKREMKKFAFANALRALVLLISLIVLMMVSYNPRRIALIFSVAEIAVFAVYSFMIFKYISPAALTVGAIKNHFVHGLKSLAGTVFMDINTKVDIIMLGFFLDDFSVGIYTLPALIIEGYHQLPFVLRNVINPVLTKTHLDRGKDELRESIKKGISITYKILIPVGILVLMVYPAAIWVFNLDESFYSGIIPLVILAAGSILAIGYFPFVTVFNQLGYPGIQSLFFSITFLSNIVLNVILIPILKIEGAALATALAFIISVLLLKGLLLRIVKIRV